MKEKEIYNKRKLERDRGKIKDRERENKIGARTSEIENKIEVGRQTNKKERQRQSIKGKDRKRETENKRERQTQGINRRIKGMMKRDRE